MPSSYLADVRAALPGLRPERPPRDAGPVCLPELARGLLAREAPAVGAAPSDAARWEALADRVAAHPELAGELCWLLRGRELPRAGESVRLTDAPVPATLSPSQVNRLLDCPFKHFGLSRLGLQEYVGPPPLRTVLGRVGHRVLALVTQRAIEAGGKIGEIDAAQWRQWFDDAFGQALREQAPLAGEAPRERFVIASFRESLAAALEAQVRRWQAGRFAPRAIELPLEVEPSDDALPGPRITVEGHALTLTGFVDRIDEARRHGVRWVLVCDYKPGVQKVLGEYLLGYPLQVLSYLWAVLEAGDETTRPAGVLIVPLWPDTKAIDTQAFRDADADDRCLRLYRPHGVVAGEVAGMLDPRVSEPGTESLMYRMRRRKDGEFYSLDPVVALPVLVDCVALARRTVETAARTLVTGEISVRPLVEKRTLACQSCPLETVCRFERDPTAIRKAETVLPKLADVVTDGAAGTGAGAVQSSQQENAG